MTFLSVSTLCSTAPVNFSHGCDDKHDRGELPGGSISTSPQFKVQQMEVKVRRQEWRILVVFYLLSGGRKGWLYTALPFTVSKTQSQETLPSLAGGSFLLS